MITDQQIVGESYLEPLLEPNAPLPQWLAPACPIPSSDQSSTSDQLPTQTPEQQSKTAKELLILQYEAFFMRVLELIPLGRTLKSIIDSDIRPFEYGAFLQWINKDPQRKALYSNAKELRTETWAGEIIEIADSLDSMEDVNRSKLRIDSRKWLMGADFRKQYGASTQIEVGGSISILGALSAAQNRIVELADVTDVEDKHSLLGRT